MRPSPPRPPPSSFFFPFQAYPGNPDPGTTIPGLSRRRSIDYTRPYAPFMAEASRAAGLPRSSSTHSFRAPFLSPASRPTSSLWSPPSGTPNHSSLALPLKARPPLPSTRLVQKLDETDKPWISHPDPDARLSWWLTFICLILGLIGAAFLCYLGLTEARKLTDDQLCLVLDDSFSSLDDSVWSPEVSLGGFSNGEFQMTTKDPSNLHISNGQLYITPTITADDIDIFNGGNFTLDGCTESKNRSACVVRANPSTGTVINPVRSARINTKGKKEIKYGRVEIRAKLPRGDWLWPSITLLPSSPHYSPPFPASGLITLLSSRGNSPSTYPYQPSNFIYSSLSYAPLPSLYHQIFGFFGLKHSSFDKKFHTFVMEWDEKFMRFYVDSRLNAMLDVSIGKKGKAGFWEKAGFPLTAKNGSEEEVEVVVENPYENGGANAPFDQPFYITIALAAGGTSGWFPDYIGDKPWYDGSLTAMRDFARAKDVWSKTWPESVDERSFRIDYVKMWEKCR